MADNSMGTCPLGGLWYTCTAQTPTFFGCCTSNPCNGVGCPSDDLRAAGMGTGSGPDFAMNDSSYWPNVVCAHGQWWTCAAQTPSFQGCCISNPCANAGCPKGNLFPAAFGTVSSTAPISTPSPTSSPAGLAATSTPSAHLPSLTSSPGPNIAAIAGGASGGAFGGVLLLLIIVFAIRKYRRGKRVSELAHSYPSNDHFVSKGPNSPYYDEAYSPGQPRYGTPQLGKMSQSPGPPAYQSPQTIPNRNRYTYEIDSTELHEIEGRQTPDLQGLNADGKIEGYAAHGLGLNYVAELPSGSRSPGRSG